MKKFSIILFLNFSLLVFSCENKNQEPEKEEEAKEISNVQEQQHEAPPIEVPRPKSMDFHLEEDITIKNLESELFGKFFDERAEFFIIEEPHKTILNANVEKMTLFYLDGRLSKLKYILDTNISNELLNNYGACKIKGLDPDDRYHMKNSEIITKIDNRYSLSENLKNYQIQWELEDKSLVMRVITNENEKYFEFEEKIKNYDRYFKTMERDKISL